MSILGVFRGLGIIDSRFVAAPDGVKTPLCTIYTLLLRSLGHSNIIALLPLTIDRAVAILLPLRHSSVITRRSCAVMFSAVWVSILIVLVNYMVSFRKGLMTAEYYEKYHRCIISDRTFYAEDMCLFIIPFMLILLMYGFMLFVIVKTKRSCGRFLVVALGIIATNLICFTPGVLIDIGIVKMGYETTQILYVTFWYVNGIFNPLIYVASHPRTRDYIKSKFGMTQ